MTHNKYFINFIMLLIITTSIGTLVFYIKANDSDKEIINLPSRSLGNTTGNISNMGIAVSDGKWDYFRDLSDGKSGLYKIGSSGFTSKIKICEDSPKFLNLYEGWIYYSNTSDNECIYKIRTDGTGRTKLNSRPSYYLHIIDGWIYYIENNKDSMTSADNIYKMNLVSREKIKLTEDSVKSFATDGRWIYYANYSDNNKLYKINTDGLNRQKLCDDCVSYINTMDGYVFYVESIIRGTLYRIKTDGSEKKVLVRDNVYFANLCGNWIYYCKGQDSGCTSRGPVYRVSIEGTQRKKVIGDDYATTFCILGKWIYVFYSKHTGESDWTYQLYRISTSGKGKKILHSN